MQQEPGVHRQNIPLVETAKQKGKEQIDDYLKT